jgi:hypothetical protein
MAMVPTLPVKASKPLRLSKALFTEGRHPPLFYLVATRVPKVGSTVGA